MLKKLISLVFLSLCLCCQPAISDTTTKILPKSKPNNLKFVKKVREKIIVPAKKPSLKIKSKMVQKNIDILPSTKPSEENKPIEEKLVKNIIDSNIILPLKKPITYKKILNKQEPESKILSKKDYEYAKEVFLYIKEKKWNSAFRQAKRVKDRDFIELVWWIYLKERSNKATFTDYMRFIDKNSDYPRINRIRYLAEHKINLNSTNPNTIIGWFDSNPPLSGFGKIKLAESYLAKGNIEKGERLLKDGWGDASLSSKDIRYLNKKYNKILNSSDHIKRAEYMAWEYKYWDLKKDT